MLPLLRREAYLTLALVFAAACGSEPRIPTTITISPSAVVLSALGETQELTTSVRDQSGNPLAEVAVSWSSSNDAVASVSPTGVVTAEGAGTADVVATVGSATGTATVSVVQTPSQVSKVAGDDQTGTAGQLLPTPLTVELKDALGNVIPGAPVTFSVAQGGGELTTPSVTTGPSGRASTTYRLGTTAGPNQVTATSEVAAVSAVFLETALPASPGLVGLYTGNGQKAPAGSQVPVPPAVRVTDGQGEPVGGVSVTFEVGTGGGSISGATRTTDVHGIAQVGSWTLGAAGTNTLIATVAASDIAGNPVTFTATVGPTPLFDMHIRFFGSPTPAQQEAFEDAEARWENLITGDLPNVPLSLPAGSCGDESPAISETIDDLVIVASVTEIDGPGAILAQAGPCYIRTAGRLTILGGMRFDEADLQEIESDGLLSDVILHEMAHVLGFGTVWSELGLLADPIAEGGTDPHFTGLEALTAFDAIGGTGYTAGAKVPVEDSDLPGTGDAHWRESVFGNELMTGFVNMGQNPLSRVTVASMDDLGYSVNQSGADSYSLDLSLRALLSGRRLHLGKDILQGPIRKVDARGRVTGVLRR